MTRGTYGNKRSATGPSGRGAYGSRTPIGISLWHTVGDRDRAVEETNTSILMIVNEVLHRMGVDPSVFVVDMNAILRDPVHSVARIQAAFRKMETSPLYPIWTSLVSPIYEEWKAFYTNQSDWEMWKTNWENYEHWVSRIEALRESVSKALEDAGTPALTTPDPSKLPSTLPGTVMDTTGTVIKRVGSGAANTAGDVWGMVKVGVYGALGIAGVIAVSSIVQQLRKDRDPLETYAQIARSNGLATARVLARRR